MAAVMWPSTLTVHAELNIPELPEHSQDLSDRTKEEQASIELQSPSTNDISPGISKGTLLPTLSVERRPSSCVFPGPGRRPSSAGYLSPRRPSVVHLSDLLPPGAFTGSRERRPSFNNVIAQVTAERRPSSSMLRIVNV
ncbi:Hypothetical protein NTJ_16345 [Nesidiocoris tenuis]|nr:Hypothetical protein NTJ_16345 [Nesidiocoris tenuis]